MKRTGFADTGLANACKEQSTRVPQATDEEAALYCILKNCSGLTQEKEELEIEYDKYSKGYWYGPLCGEDEPSE